MADGGRKWSERHEAAGSRPLPAAPLSPRLHGAQAGCPPSPTGQVGGAERGRGAGPAGTTQIPASQEGGGDQHKSYVCINSLGTGNAGILPKSKFPDGGQGPTYLQVSLSEARSRWPAVLALSC